MIEELIGRCVNKYGTSSGDNLTGFVIDMEHALESLDGVQEVRVDSTDEPLSLVNAVVIFGKSVPTIQRISQALAQAWESVAYKDIQVLSIRCYAEATVLRFVTASATHSLCVTGTVVARAAHYAKLVEQSKGLISAMPGGLPKWAA